MFFARRVLEDDSLLRFEIPLMMIMGPKNEIPFPEEIEEAKRNPNGWVYRISGHFEPDETVPPEAIIGAWAVDGSGSIVGPFIPNEKYDPGP